jgi:predicted HicB family RNase H-like nuclease
MDMKIRDVPKELHHKFKVMCAEKDISMNKLLIQLIKEAVAKEGKK